MKRILFAIVALFIVVGCSSKGGELTFSDSINLNNDGLSLWAKETMKEGTLIEANKSVKMSIMEIDQEKIKVKLLNQSCSDCGYAQSFEIHTLIDGIWYHIPVVDTYEEKPAVGHFIEGYTTQVKIYDFFEKYGVLPEGKYRIVVEGHTANFLVE